MNPPPKRAKLYRKDDRSTAIQVHFNPEKLQYTQTNNLNPQGTGRTQYVAKVSAKLSLELVFDTTADGSDVHAATMELARLMEPAGKNGPPVVVFEWGTFVFSGLIDSYQETLDFFSAEGVPLRGTVSLSLSKQEKVFEREPGDGSPTPTPEATLVSGSNATALATVAGGARLGRALAAMNGMESMRFAAGPVAVSAGVRLGVPVAFSAAGAGLSIGGELGISVGGGIGASLGVGVGASIGGGASAGIAASAGAFGGLRAAGEATASMSLDVSRLLVPPDTVGLATDAGASFSLSGQAHTEPSGSLRADVGADASLPPRLRFEGG